jgi:parallel beta-helix repeat protein
VSVRDYGAVGDGVTNDTAAIQKADIAMAKKNGVVFFPAGTYLAAGVRIDSNVEFAGEPGATLKHLNGTSGAHIVTSRVTTMKGSIVEGSNRLSVPSTAGMRPGAVVAIRGAGGASSVQASTLSPPMSSGATTLSVAQKQGWGKEPNFLLVDNEIVAYKGYSGNTMQNVVRGVLGTAVGYHPQGTRVAQLTVLYAKVASIGSTVVELDHVAVQGVTNSDVFVGSINTTIRGLTLDGSRVQGGSSSNPLPLNFELARWARVEGCTIRNGDHGGIRLDKGTVESTIQGNTLSDNGQPAAKLGAAMWLYRGSSDNTVSDNTINGDTYQGIVPDDRSVSSTEWDAPSNRNILARNLIDIPRVDWNAAIFVAGSRENVIEGNDIRSTYFGIYIAKSGQGVLPVGTNLNTVRGNVITATLGGLYVTDNDNWFERNQLISVPYPVTDKGTGNQFIENSSV